MEDRHCGYTKPPTLEDGYDAFQVFAYSACRIITDLPFGALGFFVGMILVYPILLFTLFPLLIIQSLFVKPK
jgi:hypothetical protein